MEMRGFEPAYNISAHTLLYPYGAQLFSVLKI